MRLTAKDKERIAIIQELWQCKSATEAVRIALYQLALSRTRPTPPMLHMVKGNM